MTTKRFLILLSLMAIPVVTSAVDCSESYPPGFFGIPATDSLVQAGAFDLPGWHRIAAKKIPIGNGECEFVLLSDIHRLENDRREAVAAGCYGDFDGDSKRDYALLLRNDTAGTVLPHVFLNAAKAFRVYPLEPVSDHYCFDEDPSCPPGPFRVQKPTYYYVSVGQAPPDSTLPNNDYIRVGWQTYYWDGIRFVGLWTSD